MLRILVVDNELDSSRIISALLKQAGHSVLTSHSAAEAIEHLRLGRVDLIMLDLEMPRMDGWQVLGWTRKRFTMAEMPIIGHSTTIDVQTLQMAQRFDVNKCRVKAFYTLEN